MKKTRVKKTNRVLKQIRKGLEEVKKMRAGKIKFKTLEEFLAEK